MDYVSSDAEQSPYNLPLPLSAPSFISTRDVSPSIAVGFVVGVLEQANASLVKCGVTSPSQVGGLCIPVSSGIGSPQGGRDHWFSYVDSENGRIVVDATFSQHQHVPHLLQQWIYRGID
jgi:hypothetical protein